MKKVKRKEVGNYVAEQLNVLSSSLITGGMNERDIKIEDQTTEAPWHGRRWS